MRHSGEFEDLEKMILDTDSQQILLDSRI